MSWESWRHRRLVGGALVFLGAATLLEGAACGGSTPETCTSPAALSQRYSGDTSAGVTSDRSTWRLGVLATTTFPHAYEGMVVGFRNDPNGAWRDSHPVAPDQAGAVVLKIGDGQTQFRTAVVARAGSVACNHAPDTNFSDPKPLGDLSGTFPAWP